MGAWEEKDSIAKLEEEGDEASIANTLERERGCVWKAPFRVLKFPNH